MRTWQSAPSWPLHPSALQPVTFLQTLNPTIQSDSSATHLLSTLAPTPTPESQFGKESLSSSAPQPLSP
eukprot:CAMPEP_0184327358 /NCGR_PEP_ID=MMETSP1049-20130417/143054_1 /TAXON_ID=77928 /ORGANISM="Proteomonas sulcata, Strain CCMP704" /LENGTH=68 /DNA_ID=CAMNT_0026649613 /DNA_START=1305 /DNA_END=1508 /DNA_ORIENTATION=-